MRPTKKERTVRRIKELARIYGVKLFFNKKTESLGQARFWARSISVNRDLTSRQMLSVFFHELGHIHCYDHGKWTSYHNVKPNDELTESERRLMVRTAVKAERWVDGWARAEMAKHFPGVEYYTNYGDRAVAENFLYSLKKELYG